MTAVGSENYVTEYVYNDTQGNYTTLLQKEIKTVQGENNASDVKQTVYTYDANGNQITKTTSEKTETNTYDALNQLVGFTDGTATASYTYGVSGLRDSKTVNGVTTTHIWSGSQVVVDYTTHYTATVYIRGTSLAAAFDLDEGSKGDNRFYTQNAHGDVVNITDADGDVIKSYTYDAFGVEKNISDSDTNVFRYCGEYFDTETGTIYLRARYYNPSIGRFISRDLYIGENEDPLSLNLYTYCGNNPVIFIDSNGHSWIDKLLDLIFNPMTAYAPSDDKSYVFYSIYENESAETDRNRRQAEIIQKEYSRTYGGCEVIGVNSAQEFVEQWNNLPDSVGAIQVISHGHVNYSNENANDYLNGYIYFSDNSKLYSSSFNVMGSNDRSVDNLKTISASNLYFSACNTANQDFKTNIAKSFYEKNNISQVTGWDGGVTFIFESKNPFFKVNRDYSVNGGGTAFQTLCKDGREPGQITYSTRSGSHVGGGSHR